MENTKFQNSKYEMSISLRSDPVYMEFLKNLNPVWNFTSVKEAEVKSKPVCISFKSTSPAVM